MLQSLITKLLQQKARRFLKTHKPMVVAVTGSMGKTSSREAIACVLASARKTRTASENYNNEIGMPLAVLGLKSPGRSVLGWVKALMASGGPVPEILVLEYGADKPGDVAALCELAPPTIGVFTGVSPVHVANYPSLEALVAEKLQLIKRLAADGFAVVNGDDAQALAAGGSSKAPVATYGFGATAQIRAIDLVFDARADFSFEPGETFCVTRFVAQTPHGPVEVRLRNAVGRGQVMAALAAVAVGLHFKLTPEAITRALEQYQAPVGRLKPIAGVKGSLILDDSYNASPAAMMAALDALFSFEITESSRRIAVLGDMAELGSLSEQEHRAVGLHAASGALDLLVCVGEKARDIGRAAKEAGLLSERIVDLPNSVEAGRWLDQEIRKGDIVLVKGSQSMRMEKAVKDIMAEPLHAAKLLVRQYGKWLES